MKRCLACRKTINEEHCYEYHAKCSKIFFGTSNPPQLNHSLSDIDKIAEETINRRISVTGVQPKLSLDIHNQDGKNRLTIVNMWGQFVLKPPFSIYPGLPENEDAVMHCADLAGIKTVPHAMIRFSSGELGYITKRIDRIKGSKIHMEDFCQLSEKYTNEKYNGSLESASKVILKYSSNPGFDSLRLFEIALFSFLTGNADMHLKNYSLVSDNNSEISLSPAYDLVSTALAIPEDNEEYALTINGKKSNFKKDDFNKLSAHLRINDKTLSSIYNKFSSWKKIAMTSIDDSFLSIDNASKLKTIITTRAERLGL